MAETRKLAAILVADVVGYSRLAGADEERTLAQLRGPAQRPHRPVQSLSIIAQIVKGAADRMRGRWRLDRAANAPTKGACV